MEPAGRVGGEAVTRLFAVRIRRITLSALGAMGSKFQDLQPKSGVLSMSPNVQAVVIPLTGVSIIFGAFYPKVRLLSRDRTVDRGLGGRMSSCWIPNGFSVSLPYSYSGCVASDRAVSLLGRWRSAVSPRWRSGDGQSGPVMMIGLLFSKLRLLTYGIVSSMIGCAAAIILGMRGYGIGPGVAADAVPVGLICWLIAVFVMDLTWRIRSGAPGLKWLRSAGWSGASFGIVVAAWILTASATPNPAGIYLAMRRSYIDAHWQVDPVTKLTYFPIAFYDYNGKAVPYSLFLKDSESQLKIDPLGHDLLWPRCSTASYAAHRLEDKIYVLRQYEVSPELSYSPCLITPAPKSTPPP
jgi:hypothetical protein